MSNAPAYLLTEVMVLLAAIHAFWALGGIWPAQDAKSLAAAVVGIPGMTAMPGVATTWIVAGLLLVIALWPVILRHAVATLMSPWLALLGTAIIALVFLGRGIAGYLPIMTRRHTAQPFARYNARFYSPLCLALGAGFAFLAFEGLTR